MERKRLTLPASTLPAFKLHRPDRVFPWQKVHGSGEEEGGRGGAIVPPRRTPDCFCQSLMEFKQPQLTVFTIFTKPQSSSSMQESNSSWGFWKKLIVYTHFNLAASLTTGQELPWSTALGDINNGSISLLTPPRSLGSF